MQLEAKTDLLVVTKLISVLEVQGHPAVSSGCSLREEIKLPAWTRRQNSAKHRMNLPSIAGVLHERLGEC